MSKQAVYKRLNRAKIAVKTLCEDGSSELTPQGLSVLADLLKDKQPGGQVDADNVDKSKQVDDKNDTVDTSST